MSDLFLRSIEVVVEKTKFNNDDFYIEFEIPFDDGPDANIGEVTIYNLADKTIAAMKKGSGIIVNAGYQNDIGAILIGKTQVINTDWQNVDKKTKIFVLDATDEWMQTDVNQTFKEGIKAKQILNALLPKTGLKTGALQLPVDKVYKGGRRIKGKVGKVIVEIAQDCGAKVHVNKEKIFIREKPAGDDTGFLLNKENGLIGSPTPIEKEEEMPTASTEEKGKKVIRKGWKVKSLLNHNITTDVIIKISSKTANGFFRVESGKHTSGGNNYYTEMEVYPV